MSNEVKALNETLQGIRRDMNNANREQRITAMEFCPIEARRQLRFEMVREYAGVFYASCSFSGIEECVRSAAKVADAVLQWDETENRGKGKA